MRHPAFLAALAAALVPTALAAQASTEEFAKEVLAAAPAHVAAGAAVARMEPNGTVTVLREGTNGFTCFVIPDGTNAPVCGDKATLDWFKAAFSGQPSPPNTVPGIAYMAKGGKHHEMPDGTSVLQPGPNTKEVMEPPHWMILYPFSAEATGFPDKPNAGGAYVMFGGTPYSHLMIYQDPGKLK